LICLFSTDYLQILGLIMTIWKKWHRAHRNLL